MTRRRARIGGWRSWWTTDRWGVLRHQLRHRYLAQMDRERGERFIASTGGMGLNELMALNAALVGDQNDSLLLWLRLIIKFDDALRLLCRL